MSISTKRVEKILLKAAELAADKDNRNDCLSEWTFKASQKLYRSLPNGGYTVSVCCDSGACELLEELYGIERVVLVGPDHAATALCFAAAVAESGGLDA